VARFLFSAIVLLLCPHLIGLASTYFLGHDHVYGLVPLFDFGQERNLPTLFSTCLFLISGSLFFAVVVASWRSGERCTAWLFLSIVFCFLALDEFSSLHERLTGPVREALNTSGFFYFAWVVPYGVGAGLIAILVLPTFVRLGHGLTFWFALAALIFLAGAVGFEMLGGMYYHGIDDRLDLWYALIRTLEETCELAGLVVLVYALLLLLEHKYGGLALLIGTRGGAARSAG
jgi:hypothetical protein